MLYGGIAAGAALILAGIFLPVSRLKINKNIITDFVKKAYLIFENIIGSLTSKNKPSKNRWTSFVLSFSEAGFDKKTLISVKVLFAIFMTVICLLIGLTNRAAEKEQYKAKLLANQLISMESTEKNDEKYNKWVYTQVIKGYKEKDLAGFDDKRLLGFITDRLHTVLSPDSLLKINSVALAVMNAIRKIAALRIFNINVLFFILTAFSLPDLMLIAKGLVIKSKYKKEVVKLEHVFELTGQVKGVKTQEILMLMADSSRQYRKILLNCLYNFKTDRKKALLNLEKISKNKGFSRLVEAIRVFCDVDRNMAMQILDRARMEREEEMLSTMEEDLDIIDVIAFATIIPILFEMANLFMKPMLDMIYEAFKYI